MQIIRIALEGDNFREELFFSPLRSQTINQILDASNGSISDTIDSVRKPINKNLWELIIQEVLSHFLSKEGKEFNNSGSSSPVFINSKFIKGRQQRWRQRIKINDFGKIFQMFKEVDSDFREFVLKKSEENWKNIVSGGFLSNNGAKRWERFSQSSSHMLHRVFRKRAQARNDFRGNITFVQEFSKFCKSCSSNSFNLGNCLGESWKVIIILQVQDLVRI